MLGTDLLDEWPSDELIAADSAEADLRDRSQLKTDSERPPRMDHPHGGVHGCGWLRAKRARFAVNASGVEMSPAPLN
jgi:hypothetical protein